jgi:hypothetical protein
MIRGPRDFVYHDMCIGYLLYKEKCSYCTHLRDADPKKGQNVVSASADDSWNLRMLALDRNCVCATEREQTCVCKTYYINISHHLK